MKVISIPRHYGPADIDRQRRWTAIAVVIAVLIVAFSARVIIRVVSTSPDLIGCAMEVRATQAGLPPEMIDRRCQQGDE